MMTEDSKVVAEDPNTNLEMLKDLVRRFCEDRDWDQFHDPKELAIGLITEAAELLEIFRFKSPEQIAGILETVPSRERVEDELADVFFFVLRFAQMNDVDLASALARKVSKNAAKYPIEKARGSNRKYDEF